jgi:acetyl esterase/lipase
VSFLGRLMPFAITLRGSKPRYASAERTLKRVAELRARPASWAPPASVSAIERTVNGWPVYTVGDPSAETSAVYLHGGANIYEIDKRHWALVAELAAAASIRIDVPIYPLAPISTAGPIIETVADLVTAIGATTVLGDSAGGGMSLATAMVLRDRGEPAVRVIMISPSLDLTFSDPLVAELATTDPWLDIPGAAAAAELYRGDLPLTDPRVSSIFGSLEGLGELAIFIGTRDMLYADALRLRSLAADDGHALEYHEVAGMIHVYPLLPIPEARVARRRIAELLRP